MLTFAVGLEGRKLWNSPLYIAILYKRGGYETGKPSRPLTGSDFADFGDRKLLADLGYFSCDLPQHRAKRDTEAQHIRYLEEAYDVLNLDRTEQHKLIAARLEAGRTDGVWARSTKEYSVACTRLDEAILAASPAIAQSIKELAEGKAG